MMLAFGGRAVSGFGLGDAAGDLGLSYGPNGVSFDSSKTVGQLPAPLQASANQAFNAYSAFQGGNADQAYASSVGAITTAMFALGPPGWVAGPALALIGSLVLSFGGGQATTNYAYPSSYDPGPTGSFENFANTVIRGIYDTTFAARGTGGTLADAEKRMAVGLLTAIRAWNDGHSSSSRRVVTIYGVNPCGGWGFGDPMTVAAGAIVRAAGGPCGQDFSFSINDGQPASSNLTPLVSSVQPMPITSTELQAAKPPMSTTKKVAIGAAVVGGGTVAVYAAQHGLTLVQAAKELWDKLSNFMSFGGRKGED